MEVPDLRDMVEDEVAHKDFEAQVVDKAIRYIRAVSYTHLTLPTRDQV